MSRYPYPDLLAYPPPRLDAATYQALCAVRPGWQRGENWSPPGPTEPAWLGLPVVTYSRCPLCAAPQQDRMNTVGLLGWGYGQDIRRTPYTSLPPETPLPFPACSHMLGVQVFLNLHGNLPGCRGFVNRTGEVPYLVPWLLTHPTITTRAVVHAIPLCRLMLDGAIPLWTVFCVSYFSAAREALREEYWAEEARLAAAQDDWYPFMADGRRTNPHHPTRYDLAGWMRTGAVGWLDAGDPTLPVRMGAGLVVPAGYQAIAGLRQAYRYDDGITQQLTGYPFKDE